MSKKVKVLLVISGGVLQQISSNTPEALDVLVLDYDAGGCATSVLVSRHSAVIGISDAEFMRRSLEEARQTLSNDEQKSETGDVLTITEVSRALKNMNSFVEGVFD